MSLPPIINGAHSAISLETKNVFIECTATDLTKAKIVLNTMVCYIPAFALIDLLKLFFVAVSDLVLIRCRFVVLLWRKVTMFSQYSSPRFEVEPVEVVTADAKSTLYPDLSLRTFEVDMAYINRRIGTSLAGKEVSKQDHCKT